ncbi:MAG: hypothetical protein ACOCWG_01205 [bacterium]
MNKFRFQELVILFAVASTLLYIVSRNLPPVIGSFRFFWAPFSLIIIFYTRSNAIFKGPMRFVLLYGIISVGILHYFLWNNMDDWNRKYILEDFYVLVVFTAIWSYFWVKSDFQRLALLSKWAFIFIVITIITTNIALTIDPLIVRKAASSFSEEPFRLRLFNLTGAAGYGYAQAFILLIPPLVYYIKKKKQMVFSRKVLIVILTLLFITILRTQVFANFMITSFVLFLAFMESQKRQFIFLYITLFIVIFVIVPDSFYAKIFSTIGSYFDTNSVFYSKFNDFALFIQNPELDNTTGFGHRAERYSMLMEAFLANPIWGHASANSSLNIRGGGHLYWMNKLTLWGVPGFLFFVYVLKKIYKSISSSFFNDEIRYYYLLSVLAFIMLGLTKNIAGREPWITIIVVIPGLYFFPLIQKTKIKKQK